MRGPHHLGERKFRPKRRTILQQTIDGKTREVKFPFIKDVVLRRFKKESGIPSEIIYELKKRGRAVYEQDGKEVTLTIFEVEDKV